MNDGEDSSVEDVDWDEGDWDERDWWENEWRKISGEEAPISDVERWERLRHQVDQNDPGLLRIYIGEGNDEYKLHHGDKEEFGIIIGRNTHIHELMIDMETTHVVAHFFGGLASNKSIKKLMLLGCDHMDEETFLLLVPFFQTNHAFESLVISHVFHERLSDSQGERLLSTLVTALGKFDSLKEFIFSFRYDTTITITISDEVGGKLIKALAGHIGLKKLDLIKIQIGREGCTAISSLLQNPHSKLSLLGFHSNQIDNEGAMILSSALNGNNAIREFKLCNNLHNITEIGWRSIFNALKSPHCCVEKLNLSQNCINETAALSLHDALSNNTTIKALVLQNLSNFWTIAPTIFQLLRSSTCMLESLDFSNNHDFGDEVLVSLINALANNSRLRKLYLSFNSFFLGGWLALVQLLQRPSCCIECLQLGGSNLSDDIIVPLANALSNNSRLRELSLSNNGDVTAVGWEALVGVFRNPNSTLEVLDLSNNRIDDQVMVPLADVLANNEKLKALTIGYRTDMLFRPHVTSNDSGAAFSRMLCNTSSILGTYNSNHTLEKLCREDFDSALPANIMSLLRINRESSKIQAARIKIINTHFSGTCMNTQVLTDMELNVIPIAIGWMGRDGGSNGFLFALLRSMPSLCDTKSKRK